MRSNVQQKELTLVAHRPEGGNNGYCENSVIVIEKYLCLFEIRKKRMH